MAARASGSAWRLLLATLCAASAPALAQFSVLPTPQPPAAEAMAAAASAAAADYKIAAARHIYASYGPKVYRGKLPPLLYGIAIVEIQVDEAGLVTGANLLRPPAAKEVGPWVLQMILRAGPFPASGRPQRFNEIWLVDKSGLFQLDSLTEGQR